MISELPAFSNVTDVEHTSFGHVESLQCNSELLWRLEDVLLGKNPSPPVHAQSLFASSFLEDMHRVMRIDMSDTPYMTGGVCTDGD